MTFTVASNYNITATYSGDGNFNASATAAPLVQMVSGPTAANASVSGRVVDLSGRGISGARVSMQSQAGDVVWAITNPFGYYRFAEIPTGQSYLVSVSDKRFEFVPRTVTINEDLTDLDFTPVGESSRGPGTSGSELGNQKRSP
jgi:hypothetical protein